MKYDFDRIIDRTGTGASKWERYTAGKTDNLNLLIDPHLKGDSTLPMWVADMDFQVPQPVIDALVKRSAHGIFGYTVASKSYFRSIIDWFLARYNWKIEEEWIIPAPGVVPAIQFAINVLCKPEEKILIQGPVYHPFYRVIKSAGCEIVSNSLRLDASGYNMDFSDLGRQLSDPLVKLAILCSPHNPVGRVWTVDELTRFGELCDSNGVTVIADEIHCDLVFSSNRFIPYGSIKPDFLNNVLICTAPSKTFNLAGMHLSNIIIPNELLRHRYKSYIEKNSLSGGLNPLALSAAEVAYQEGEEWLEQVLDYVWENYQFLQRSFGDQLSKLSVSDLQGTYLAWVDFRSLGIEANELERLIQSEANLLFNQGYIFGREGIGFQRINIACPRSVLERAVKRLIKVFAHL